MAEDEREPATLTEHGVADDMGDSEDPAELLRTVELHAPVRQLPTAPSSLNESLLTTFTRPIQPLLEARTQPRAVPAELLRHAQPTVDMPAAERYEFDALVDAHGRISLPEKWRTLFAHQVVRVILRIDDE